MSPDCVIIKNYNTAFRCVAYYKQDIEDAFKSSDDSFRYAIAVKDQNNNEYIVADMDDIEDALDYASAVSRILEQPSILVYRLYNDKLNDSIKWYRV